MILSTSNGLTFTRGETMTQTTRTNHGAEIPLPVSTRDPIDPVRQILDQIDEFLLNSNSDSERLWDVLSALRGPDKFSYGDKVTTTNAIRVAAFPRTANADNLGAISLPAIFWTTGYQEPTIDICDYESEGWHFAQHIRNAARVLKLQDETGK